MWQGGTETKPREPLVTALFKAPAPKAGLTSTLEVFPGHSGPQTSGLPRGGQPMYLQQASSPGPDSGHPREGQVQPVSQSWGHGLIAMLSGTVQA